MTFGKVIKYYREKKDISQGALASRIGVSRAYISLLESDKAIVGTPSIENLTKIAEELGIDRQMFMRLARKPEEDIEREYQKAVDYFSEHSYYD